MTEPVADLNTQSPMATRIRNLVVALTAIALSVALFLGLQTQNPSTSLSELAETSTPLEVALENEKPTLMEFYANWCLSCQAMVPDMVALREGYGEQVNFVMLNVDNTKWLPEMDAYRVDGIPHFVFLDRQGEAIAETIGELPKPILKDKLDALVAGVPIPDAGNIGKVSSLESGSRNEVPMVSDPRSHGSQVVQ
ncbi:MAG: thioredoxin family protein [Roseofilum sp. SBFL]|uniref:thioredoxin family protein n=1 Tax=unclassified Roseofilum TaxID=2620099 RepID=UPI001B0B8998|nr:MULTISPECIES: thioredoxin family protein [unclassified Roseofilum]MBP0015697.1 thioredoxin family protein [Roseofilum sp. SID3]MBP0025384.1 thioredoxin family protein [Roseofilum sp. SID2]MBP0036839.1 thioredoxin family protein [Roseofilum sp. SID1]MBP0043792.1 thioredoxin family protein [Roseofilum sp. SBFL]